MFAEFRGRAPVRPLLNTPLMTEDEAIQLVVSSEIYMQIRSHTKVSPRTVSKKLVKCKFVERIV